MSELSGLTQGRMVSYVLPESSHWPGQTRPAVIAQVWNHEHDSHPGMSNLVVFKSRPGDGGKDEDATFIALSVSYDPSGKPGTWHWPQKQSAAAPSVLKELDLTVEEWREYDFPGRTYRVTNPVKLYLRDGGSTHRIVDANGISHCVPAPGVNACVLRWKSKDANKPVEF